MRIPEEHKRALNYVEVFKLKRRPFVMNSAKTFKFARNTRQSMKTKSRGSTI